MEKKIEEAQEVEQPKQSITLAELAHRKSLVAEQIKGLQKQYEEMHNAWIKGVNEQLQKEQSKNKD